MQRQSEKVTKVLPCAMSGRNGGRATKPALMHAQGSSFRTPGTVGASDIVHVTRFPMPPSLHTASNEVLEVVKAWLGISKVCSCYHLSYLSTQVVLEADIVLQ